ncbi:hypothetical protein CYMTET_41218 [Cymbomonas tetramitiformis]|uniref:Uncharacterized protein n=1 Tax=Cymbomonas tetramitiformis TaxID=36881 RepID=A0AAE0F2H0_9CHLO|nr:hypothetical protein CYMTET_41218 [Cymbomonas tetramitiformis]
MLYGHSLEAIGVTNYNVEATYEEYLENVETLEASVESAKNAEEHETQEEEVEHAEKIYDSYLNLYGDCGNYTESWTFTRCACDSNARNLMSSLKETCEYTENYSLYFKAELLSVFVATAFLVVLATAKRTVFSTKPITSSTCAAIFLGICCTVTLLVLAIETTDISEDSSHYMLLGWRVATYAVFLLGILFSILWMLEDEKTSHRKEGEETPYGAGVEPSTQESDIIELKDITPAGIGRRVDDA